MRLRLLLSVTAIALGAWGIYAYLRPREPDSFSFWRWRAGVPFDSLRARARREQRVDFNCEPILGPHRLCQLRSAGLPLTGPPGALRVLVDSAGTAVAITFRPLIDSTRIRGEARQSAREWKADVDAINTMWGSVAASLPEYDRMRDRTTRATWRTIDGRFTAAVRERDGKPVDLTIADSRALARISDRSTSGPLTLARAGFAGEEFSPLVDAAALGLSSAMLRPVAGIDVGPVVDSPPSIRACDATPSDTVTPGDSARALHGSGIVALLAEIVPRLHPGSRVVAGARLYFVAAGGAAEEMHVMYDESAGHDVIAIALYFRRRGDAALSALERHVPIDRQCRAPAELLLVRRRDAGVPEVERLTVDGEAPWSRITSLEFAPGAEHAPALHVTYETGYATEAWLGTIAWAASIATNPARMVTRTPIQYGKRLAVDSSEIAGVFVVSRASPDILEVTAAETFGTAPRPKPLRVSVGRGARFSGFRLIDAF